MRENKETFIFDLDGTLVDSFDQITEAANVIRFERGHPPLEKSKAESLIGLPAIDLFRDISDDSSEISKIIYEFRKLLGEKILSGNIVYDGVLQFLNLARKQNLLTAIATSKPQMLAENVVLNSSLHGLIDFVQGTDGFDPKPSPDVILRVLSSVDSKTAVMFGDRPEDMMAAKAAGVPGVGISQSVFSSSELLESGASLVFDNFECALNNVDEILSLNPRK